MIVSALTWDVFLDGLRRGEPWAYLVVGFLVLVTFMACLTWASPNIISGRRTDDRDA